MTYYVLFFLPLESRRVPIAGITAQPDQNGMQQIARNATLDPWGYLHHCRYVLHDRDTKFCAFVPEHFIDSQCEVPDAAPPESRLERVG